MELTIWCGEAIQNVIAIVDNFTLQAECILICYIWVFDVAYCEDVLPRNCVYAGCRETVENCERVLGGSHCHRWDRLRIPLRLSFVMTISHKNE